MRFMMLRALALMSATACAASPPPVLKLGTHVASLGMRFYTGAIYRVTYAKGRGASSECATT